MRDYDHYSDDNKCDGLCYYTARRNRAADHERLQLREVTSLQHHHTGNENDEYGGRDRKHGYAFSRGERWRNSAITTPAIR